MFVYGFRSAAFFCIIPVSYTHLDVYKRQEKLYERTRESLGLNGSLIEQYIHWIGNMLTWLLYTSRCV